MGQCLRGVMDTSKKIGCAVLVMTGLAVVFIIAVALKGNNGGTESLVADDIGIGEDDIDSLDQQVMTEQAGGDAASPGLSAKDDVFTELEQVVKNKHVLQQITQEQKKILEQLDLREYFESTVNADNIEFWEKLVAKVIEQAPTADLMLVINPTSKISSSLNER